MATRTEIKDNIENTRENITHTVDEISKKFDLQERIREKPYNAILAAMAAGFLISTLSTPIGRSLMRLGFKTAATAAGGYLSKKGMDYVRHKVIT